MSKLIVFSILVLFFLTSMGIAQDQIYDFGGRTVTIVSYGGPYTWDFEEGGRAPGLHETANELFNVNIEFLGVPWNEYSEHLMTRLLSGDSANDIWLMQQRQFWQLVSLRAFTPASDLLPQDYWDKLPKLPRAMAQALTYQGKTYGVGLTYGAVAPLEYLVWNMDLFEREGLPNLYEIYEAGEWTWDVFTEIAIQATRDTTGDGEIDQFGFSGKWPPRVVWLALTNGATVTREDEEGNIIFTLDESAAIEALQWVHDLVNVYRVTNGNWPAFVDGKNAMSNEGLYVIGNNINPNMEEHFGVVPLPRGPRASEHIYPAHAMETWVLPANSEAPEAKVALLDFLFPHEYYDEALTTYISNRVRDRESYRVVMDGHDAWNGEVFALEYVVASVLNPAINAILSGDQTPAAAISEVKPQIQAIIDELYNQH